VQRKQLETSAARFQAAIKLSAANNARRPEIHEPLEQTQLVRRGERNETRCCDPGCHFGCRGSGSAGVLPGTTSAPRPLAELVPSGPLIYLEATSFHSCWAIGTILRKRKPGSPAPMRKSSTAPI